METFELDVTGDYDLKFTGELLARSRTGDHDSTRYTEFELYKSEGGRFVCHKKHITKWDKEDNTYEAEWYNDVFEIINFFGLCDDAKALYTKAGIDCTTSVD